MEESGLADRLAQCKAEAINLFEQGRYGDCVERFKVLVEIEPANSDLRHYLEVSREQVEKAQSPQVSSPLAELVNPPEDEVSPNASQIPEPAPPAASRPEARYVPVDVKSVVESELPKRQSIRLFEPSQQESGGPFR